MEERIAKINRFTTGWMGYFRLADTPRVFSDLDEWFRRGMRQIRWKEWKRPRTRRSNLLKLGINGHFSSKWGYSGKGYWRIAGSAVLQRALPNSHWEGLGLHMLKPTWQRLRSAR
jgi:RNA-directed DNA polymerase